MNPTVVVWLAGIIVFVVLEAATYQMVCIWFALGAVGGLIAETVGASFNVQMTVFLIISVLCLIGLRPLSKKLVKHETMKTNVDSLIGKEVLVTEEVDNLHGKGEGKVGGMVWSVRSADNTGIAENEIAIVEEVKGVKLIVKKKGV